MKKILGLLLMTSLIISGCGEKEEKKVEAKEVINTCELVQGDSDFEATTNYTIYSKGGAVTKVEIAEKYVSEKKDLIEYFNTTTESSYKALNKLYGGYKYEIKVEDNALTTEVTVDYTKMDIDQYVEDNPAMADYLTEDGKIEAEGIIALYKSLSAYCE